MKLAHLSNFIRISVLPLITIACAPLPGEVSQALKRELEKGSLHVNLAEIAKGDWDEVILFAPYALQSDVCPVLQLSPKNCSSLLPEMVPEARYLLAFRLSGRVVHHEYHNTRNGNFITKEMVTHIPRVQSSFQVETTKEQGLPYWYLSQQSYR